MTPEEVFHNSLEEYGCGGRLDMTGLPTSLSGYFIDHAHRLRSLLQQESAGCQKFPPIHFDWVNNADVNAVAFGSQVGSTDHYFIGINYGAVLFLQVVFDCMLASKQAFPKIGNPSGEADFRCFPAMPLNIDELMASGVEHTTPKDPVRQNFVTLMLRTVIDFTFRHELSHILDGHVNYGSQRGLPFRFEVPPTPSASADDWLFFP